MIYLTQLIHVREGREADFQQFEEIVLPRLSRYPVSFCCVFAPIRRPRSLDPASCRMKCTSSASKPRKVSLATRTTRSGNVGYTSRISPSAAFC